MTDSRVTPQTAAVEAAAKAISGYDERLWLHWRDGAMGQRYMADAKAALAAAAPLLCQPLQDEIDRLRAAILEAARDIEREKTAYLPDGADHCEVAANAALDLAAWIVRDRLQLPGLVTGR